MAEVSVIVPLHNAARHIPALLERLDRLSGAELEFVLIDDHSTDGGDLLVEAWVPKHARRKVVLRARHTGVAAARNQAVEAAAGEFLWFADADDGWRDDVVQRLLECARAGDHDVAVCNATRIDPQAGATILIEDAPAARVMSGAEATTAVLRGEIQGHLWNKLFRRTLFTEPAFPATRAHSDLGGTLRVLSKARSVILLPEALYDYYIRVGSVLNSRAYRWSDLEDVLGIAHSVSQVVDPSAGRRNLVLFSLQKVWLPLAHEAIRRRSTSGATEAWLRARRNMRWGQLLILARSGYLPLAARGFAMKAFPTPYRALYAAYRRRRWKAIDV